jgi:fructose-bisphosphate aldolase class 1
MTTSCERFGGVPLAEVLVSRGIAPGIKVDTGAKALAAFPGGDGDGRPGRAP